LSILSDELLSRARKLIEDEYTNLRIQAENVLGGELDANVLSEEWIKSFLHELYLPVSHRLVSRETVLGDSVLRNEYTVQLKQRFEALKASFVRDNNRISKASQRVSTLTKGFENRCLTLLAESTDLAEKERILIIEEKALSRIAHDEQVAIISRLALATETSQNEIEKERVLQQTFSDLSNFQIE
jgi:hypothetical protein